MKKLIVIGVLVLGLGACVYSFKFSSSAKTQSAILQQVDYSLWTDILQQYVNEEGLVNYKALAANKDELNRFIDQIEQVDVTALSDVEQKAFWINAYNAITLDVVTDAYPVKSIRTIDLGLVWEKPRSVAGQALSLGHIEHKILRSLGDARIHFAINCASIGCPNLPQKPFYPDQLDQLLHDAAVAFVNNPEKVHLDREENTLYYSEIFNWFKKDFLLEASSIKEYIVKYINQSDAEYIRQNSSTVDKIPYDWGLNEQK